MNRSDCFDFSAELDKKYGKPGTESYEKFIDEAWAEYNAQVLLDARKHAKLTQAEVAQRIGAEKGYISRIERGQTIPSVATFYKIAAAMGCTVVLQPALM